MTDDEIDDLIEAQGGPREALFWALVEEIQSRVALTKEQRIRFAWWAATNQLGGDA